jgi:hypothetical protein
VTKIKELIKFGECLLQAAQSADRCDSLLLINTVVKYRQCPLQLFVFAQRMWAYLCALCILRINIISITSVKPIIVVMEGLVFSLR